MARVAAEKVARRLRRRELQSTIGGLVLLVLAGISITRSLSTEESLPSEFDPACEQLREKDGRNAHPQCVTPEPKNPRDIVDEIEATQREAWENLPNDFPGMP